MQVPPSSQLAGWQRCKGGKHVKVSVVLNQKTFILTKYWPATADCFECQSSGVQTSSVHSLAPDGSSA